MSKVNEQSWWKENLFPNGDFARMPNSSECVVTGGSLGFPPGSLL